MTSYIRLHFCAIPVMNTGRSPNSVPYLKRKRPPETSSQPDPATKRVKLSPVVTTDDGNSQSLPSPFISPPIPAEPAKGRKQPQNPFLLAAEITLQAQSPLQTMVSAAAHTPSVRLPNLTPPFFLSFSLSHLCSYPTRPLGKILDGINMSFTFSRDFLLDCIKPTSEMERKDEVSNPGVYVVLVDAARTDVVTTEFRSITRALTEKLKVGELAGDRRVYLFD
jgi:hypothetical protein